MSQSGSHPQTSPASYPSPQQLPTPTPGGAPSPAPGQAAAQPAPPPMPQQQPQYQPPAQGQNPYAQPQQKPQYQPQPSQGGGYPQGGQQPQYRPAQQAPQPGGAQPAPNMGGYGGPAPMGGQVPPPDMNREGGEKPLPRISIHAFCDRPDTAGVIQSAHRDWRMSRTNLQVYMGGLPGAIGYYQENATPGLILIESPLRGPELFNQLEALASVCNEDTKVVMIGAANDIQLYRQLMEAGISDYLVPPFHPLQLIRSISELYLDPENPFVGRTIAFIGAKGGVGSSTICHNVAWALATQLKQETALIDLDSSWGTVGLDFNHEAAQGLEDALSQTDRLDATLLDRLMVKYSDHLSLLPASGSLTMKISNNAEDFEAVINGIRAVAPLSVLDVPHIWNDWVSQTLISADLVVITATPDLACLRNAKNLVEFLKENCPNDVQPLLIINKTGVPKAPEIPVKDFAAALGLNPVLVLPYEPISFSKASNEGKMLSEIEKGSKVVDGFVHLANELRGGGNKITPVGSGKPSKEKKSLLAGLFKRK